MATLPPRRNPSTTKVAKQHLTPLQTLLQMGFPKHRAEKALAATGNRGVQLASDWLLAHVNDSFLDDTSPREYILYACPVGGSFLEDLQNLWSLSMTCCGWNGAHNFTPHITLVSFFKAPNEDSLHLSQMLKSVMERQGATLNEPLKLEMYSSPNFMGFFVAEEHADYLKRIAMQYVKEVSNSTISLEPHVKSLHLTLAYQFPSKHYTELKLFVDFVDPRASSEWELRLYSRDPRMNGKHVHKVIRAYCPQKNDELELHIGDYVYLASNAVAVSPDGWVDGMSWLTGLSGLLPVSYTVRTAESDAWTLHTKVPLNNIQNQSSDSPLAATTSTDEDSNNATQQSQLLLQQSQSQQSQSQQQSHITTATTSTALTTDETDTVTSGGGLDDVPSNKETVVTDGSATSGVVDGEQASGVTVTVTNTENTYENVTNVVNVTSQDTTKDPLSDDHKPQRLLIMRHGERVDFTFGSWIPFCFDERGVYTRKDLNMPVTVPHRRLGPKGFQKDSPLTNVGVLQATLVGEALREKGIRVQHVYCSPSYRCVQTCDAVLTGLGIRDSIAINLEPGLFEWLVWYPEFLPDWLTPAELLTAGYHINPDYTPHVPRAELLEARETCDQFYQRSAYVTRCVLGGTGEGNVLFVGHAASVEVCSRELVGLKPRIASDMTKVIQKVPYCSLVMLERQPENSEKISNGGLGNWALVEPPCPPVTHSNNPRFDWKIIHG